jgi:hypothetical protein
MAGAFISDARLVDLVQLRLNHCLMFERNVPNLNSALPQIYSLKIHVKAILASGAEVGIALAAV